MSTTTNKSNDTSLMFLSSCVFCSIICFFIILSLIQWYWRIQIISQSITMGRPGIAAGALLSGMGPINLNI